MPRDFETPRERRRRLRGIEPMPRDPFLYNQRMEFAGKITAIAIAALLMALIIGSLVWLTRVAWSAALG